MQSTLYLLKTPVKKSKTIKHKIVLGTGAKHTAIFSDTLFDDDLNK